MVIGKDVAITDNVDVIPEVNINVLLRFFKVVSYYSRRGRSR